MTLLYRFGVRRFIAAFGLSGTQKAARKQKSGDESPHSKLLSSRLRDLSENLAGPRIIAVELFEGGPDFLGIRALAGVPQARGTIKSGADALPTFLGGARLFQVGQRLPALL